MIKNQTLHVQFLQNFYFFFVLFVICMYTLTLLIKTYNGKIKALWEYKQKQLKTN